VECINPLWALKEIDYKKTQTNKDGKTYHKMTNWHSAKNFTPTKEMQIAEIINGRVWTKIPCGECWCCRLNYASQWADRCIDEASQYKNNYFVTLTYDNEHLPTAQGINKSTGEVGEVGTLKKEDLQKFMKDLRSYYKYHYKHEGIRFYACGEYGDKYARPHYHLIIFNLPIEDLKKDHNSRRGQLIYRSEIIEKIWGKGLSGIGEVTWESASYTARYVMKKLKGLKAKEYEELGITPEFVNMSLKPGIGGNWYKEHKEHIYQTDYITRLRKDKIIQKKPSKYYDKLYDIEEPEQMKKIKSKRKQNNAKKEMFKLDETDMNLEQYYIQLQNITNKKVQRLHRGYEKTGY